jgi:acyl-CoA reductase-like NAD-dependent aldehyde dehydrogenase
VDAEEDSMTLTRPHEDRASEPMSSGADTITVLDPRDGSLVGRIAMTPLEEIPATMARARAAAAGWAATAPEERGRRVRAAGELLAARADELAALCQRETGRPYEEALGGVLAGAGTLTQYAELGPLQFGRRLRGSTDAVDYSIAEPRGVVVAVTPWNDPVAIAAGLLGAALVTGNAVVHKPSERCPHLGELLGEVLAAAFPDGVLTTVTGDARVGAALVDDDADVIAHVGSTAAGEAIARAALPRGIHVVRENGGNDALIVDDDVDPDWAAQQAVLGAYTNAGQLCTSVERILVHSGIAEDFLDALVRRSQELTGALGPLVDDRARQNVHAHVTESLNQGARALTGARIPSGNGTYYPPTVLVDCTPSMPVFDEETFGPIAAVRVVADFDEALALAAADRYGLSATVLTNSMQHAIAATRLPVGTVKVNGVFGGAPGGSAEPRGASGRGFGYGPELLGEFTTTKVVHLGIAQARSAR